MGPMINFYNDDAVRRYAPYKFVLAFENTRAAGYVTEKLVNAFLAGSVPVYWGDSKTVSELFNPESFIDCGRFDSLQDCAEYVAHVDDSPEMYTRMRREAPVANMTAFNEAFSWHPTVPSRFMADAVLRHFHN
ncbi:putative fucosyltransferase R654 [Phytophthora ramorum]|uniref:putative fucosyltransferase R654 n=1 Tax=Phytophthora ramorum TaxID=164328 RepID=UPI0030AA100D|nr:putative fucosyltransferase R654 [Phytophthora ramorum]